MEKKFELTPEIKAKLKQAEEKIISEGLSPEDLDDITGGAGPRQYYDVYLNSEEGEAEFGEWVLDEARAFKRRGSFYGNVLVDIRIIFNGSGINLVDLDTWLTKEKYDSL